MQLVAQHKLDCVLAVALGNKHQTINIKICRNEIQLEAYDLQYLEESYYLDKRRRFTHGGCWAQLDGFTTKEKLKLLNRPNS